ncbi:hypothetical protein IWX90DRAFT_434019 [Phyllosticta citrichinensis]|uniref:Secreted protein n=1 Tax=Phyllosticta citrichinensis TaxID=1130410 RepID=A0ABR1XUF8_9PEZI
MFAKVFLSFSFFLHGPGWIIASVRKAFMRSGLPSLFPVTRGRRTRTCVCVDCRSLRFGPMDSGQRRPTGNRGFAAAVGVPPDSEDARG